MAPEGCTEADVRAAVDDFFSDIIDVVDLPATVGGSWTWHIVKVPTVAAICRVALRGRQIGAGVRIDLFSKFPKQPTALGPL